MVGRGEDKALRRGVQRSGYVVDPRAVAEAMLRSGVLVAGQPRNGAVGTEKDKAATG
jgi:hypothetical protein